METFLNILEVLGTSLVIFKEKSKEKVLYTKMNELFMMNMIEVMSIIGW